ncbi:MAG TPA: hypothetical protein VFP42_07725 [Acidimicrobiia bacterium]|nr:hypothetical protein [Acidimicrobiia bacterium]
MTQTSTHRWSTGATILGIVGIVAYALTGFLFVSSGLVVPAPWLFVLWAAWIVGIYLVIRLFVTRRALTLLAAVAAVAFWWVFITLGESILDWTA